MTGGHATRLSALLERHGWAVVNMDGWLDLDDQNPDMTVPTAMLSLLGRPFQAYKRWNLWKPLGVDLSAGSGKATAADFIPLHIDLVNSTAPPDYSCLLVQRPDPAGGGESIVSSFEDALSDLSADDVADLHQTAASDGEFYDIVGVGMEYNPFPILNNEDQYIRFTAKWGTAGPPQLMRAIKRLDSALLARAMRRLVDKNEMIIVDQRRIAHGREPLGPRQHEIAESERRLILQTFVRAW